MFTSLKHRHCIQSWHSLGIICKCDATVSWRWRRRRCYKITFFTVFGKCRIVTSSSHRKQWASSDTIPVGSSRFGSVRYRNLPFSNFRGILNGATQILPLISYYPKSCRQSAGRTSWAPRFRKHAPLKYHLWLHRSNFQRDFEESIAAILPMDAICMDLIKSNQASVSWLNACRHETVDWMHAVLAGASVRYGFKLYDHVINRWYLFVCHTVVDYDCWLRAFDDERRRVTEDRLSGFDVSTYRNKALISHRLMRETCVGGSLHAKGECIH